MKRYLKYLFSLVVVFAMIPQQANAQQDAGILLPILEKWKTLQIGKFADQAKTMLDDLNTTFESLKTAQNTNGIVGKAYKLSTTLFTGMDDIYKVYYEMDNLYKRCRYAYKYIESHLANGDITLSDASYILSTIAYMDTAAQRTISDIISLLKNEDLTVDFKLKKFKESWNNLKGMGQMVSDQLKETQEKIESDKEYEALSQLALNAYGQSSLGDYGIVSSSWAKKVVEQQTMKKGKTRSSGRSSSGSNSSGDASNGNDDQNGYNYKNIQETATSISSLGTSILNIICVVIFLLFIIMAIPAYIRRNQGHQQSQDAIIKLFRGTVIIIFVIQVMGRLLFTVAK